MSIIGKKVLIVVPHIGKDGQIDEAKNNEYSATVIDKFMNGYPNPNNPAIQIQCENYLIEKENGEVENCHPSFVVKIIK